jgi:hypothetical protein
MRWGHKGIRSNRLDEQAHGTGQCDATADVLFYKNTYSKGMHTPAENPQLCLQLISCRR